MPEMVKNDFCDTRHVCKLYVLSALGITLKFRFTSLIYLCVSLSISVFLSFFSCSPFFPFAFLLIYQEGLISSFISQVYRLSQPFCVARLI